jgi:hypothetical protein
MKRLLAAAIALSMMACATTSKTPPPQTAPKTTTPAPTPAAAAKPAPGAKPATPTPTTAPQAPAAGAPAAAPRSPDQAGAPEGAQRPDRPAAGDAPAEPKPYDKVITKEAKSDEGVFTVHRIKEKVYYEIPKKEFGKDFLWVTQIARTTLGVGYGGQALGNRVVRWERRDNRVLLRSVSYDMVADPSLPVAKAVQAANNDAILQAFNVEAVGKDEAPVIDVTKLFTTEVPEFSARTRLRASGFDASRSFLDRIVSFPENIEVEATHTYTAQAPPPGQAAAPAPAGLAASGMRPGSASIVIHYSMVKLPEKPMQPRIFDERVGYFSVEQQDFGKDEHRAPTRTYITRYRLEKKDPAAAVSDPVKPIVYYVDAATPAKWIPWMIKGIEEWQVAFEAAGFRKAIIGKRAPTPAEDPDFSPEDARYSVIRWLPSTIENASGPHIHDPRTGEILESDIQFYHNVMNLARDWYFTQVGPLDPRAKTLPLPDDLMGRLIEYIVAHEVGHTLGFQHNMKASSLYPIEKVRDREWVKKMGHTPTLMDYSRFNYVAQPEDGIAVEDLVPKIGPYDNWATAWGYKPIPSATSAEDEKKTLDQWAREQDTTPYLRFSTANQRGSDPGDQTEAVGDADAVMATGLGIKNLKRVADMLIPATTKAGEPFDDLTELYDRMIGQWSLELNHVVPIVGGFTSQQKAGGQQGVVFTPVPRERQAAAVKFLNEQAFATPTFLIRTDILRRIEPSGVLDRIRTAQTRVLTNLMSPTRFTRLIEQESIDKVNAYKAVDFLADVRKGVWGELDRAPVVIDATRRALQRAYIDLMNEKLNGRAPVADDARAFIRGELKALSAQIGVAQAGAADRATRLHLDDARDQIARALDPKVVPAAAAAAAAGAARPGLTDDLESWPITGPMACWPDYAIRAGGVRK